MCNPLTGLPTPARPERSQAIFHQVYLLQDFHLWQVNKSVPYPCMYPFSGCIHSMCTMYPYRGCLRSSQQSRQHKRHICISSPGLPSPTEAVRKSYQAPCGTHSQKLESWVGQLFNGKAAPFPREKETTSSLRLAVSKQDPENGSDGNWAGPSFCGVLSKIGASRRDSPKGFPKHLPSEGMSWLRSCSHLNLTIHSLESWLTLGILFSFIDRMMLKK